jgi:P pilus assembly chaperone PapD
MKRNLPRSISTAIGLVGLVSVTTPARAEIVLSQVIVDFQPGAPAIEDIEVFNAGDERVYVVAEPAEIVAPGLAGEARVTNPDPDQLGLLVTPQKLVLEPQQRRIVRISAIAPRSDRERIYRVMVRPVAGKASAETSALKVLVGYDMLVLMRPIEIKGQVTAERNGRQLTIRNDSNTAYELFDGIQCDATGKNCGALTAIRLYPGAALAQDLRYDTVVKYRITSGSAPKNIEFK